MCPGTHKGTGAKITFCPGNFQGVYNGLNLATAGHDYIDCTDCAKCFRAVLHSVLESVSLEI